MTAELLPPVPDPLAALGAAVDAFIEASGDMPAAGDTELVVDLGQLIDRLVGIRLTRLGSVDASGAWGLDGSRTTRAWLVRTTTCSAAKAGRDLQLARAMRDHLPATATAVHVGECSIEHAAVLAAHACDSDVRRDALPGPDGGEALLLTHTGFSVGDFTTITRRWAAQVDPDAEDAAHRARRSAYEVFVADTLDGGDLAGRLSPEATHTLSAALKAITGVPAAGDRRTPGQRTHDALATLAAMALAGGTLGQSASVPPSLVVHVNVETLTASTTSGLRVASAGCPDGSRIGGPAWWQANGHPVPRNVLEKIACDARVSRIVLGPGSVVLDLGRARRTFTRAQRRGLDARDGGCRRPGCNAPPQLSQGHHLIHWMRGGATSVSNGLLLCWACHDWVHAYDISITRGPRGALIFTGRDGRDHGTSYPRAGPPPWPR